MNLGGTVLGTTWILGSVTMFQPPLRHLQAEWPCIRLALRFP